jgi:glucose-1-phosphate adenylyltransferase
MTELAAPTADPRLNAGTLALVLAGGSGRRLGGLTTTCAKAAVPYGGHYRVIDFVLSNCVNSQVRRIAVLTQYKSQPLIRHVQGGWGFLHRELGEFIDVWPAQQHRGERWYTGTVDAVEQNLELIEAARPDFVLVLAGDQIYSMDYSHVIDQHVASRADVTVACVEMPATEARAYDVAAVDADLRVRAFTANPHSRVPSFRQRDVALAAMGVYVFDTNFLFDRLAQERASDRDFAGDVLPAAAATARVFAYLFRDAAGLAPGYWRNVGTVDRYWRAHMDLLAEPPPIRLGDPDWPIFTRRERFGPARVSAAAQLHASLVSAGCDVDGEVHRSVLSTCCHVGQRTRIHDSVLLPGVRVGARCRLNRVIVASDCVIPDDTVLDAEAGAGGHYLSPGGVLLVAASPRPPSRGDATTRKVA